MDNILNLTAIKKANESLKKAYQEYSKTKNEYVRDSVIQRFEYTYELSVKMIRRFLELNSDVKETIDGLFFNDLIRTASEKFLINGNLEDWAIFRQKRNLTSHIYDEKKAEEVISIVEKFIEEVDFLIKQMSA